MAKNVLPVDFQDDILSEDMNGRRKYQMITNSDGTVSFVDVTEYTQVGSNFGQAQINATNEAVNESADKNKIIDDKDDLVANSQAGMMAGALAVKAIREELNQKIQNKIQYDVVAENENRDLYLMFQRVTDVEFVNGVGYVNNNLSGGDRVVRAFAQPESVTGVVIASCQAQSANNRMELHCINIDDGTPYSGSTVGYINLFILVTRGS